MDDQLTALLRRADEAIAESQKLQRQCRAQIGEAQAWLERVWGIAIDMGPFRPRKF